MLPKIYIKKEYSILFFVAGVFILLVSLADIAENTAPLLQRASAILHTCAEETNRPACYDREIPKLMDEGLSMEEAFAVTKRIQEEDDTYFYCHVVGHNISAKETAKDPSKWKEVIARVPHGVCSNGGIHGAFQERFRSAALPDAKVEELRPVLQNICGQRDSWNPTRLEQATCTHALGHLAMYVTGGDTRKSAALCDETAINADGYDFRQICYDGVFMQIFQPLEPEDFILVEGKQPEKEELRPFCFQFTGKQRESCWSEGWPLYYKEIQTPRGLEAFCGAIADSGADALDRCYNGLFYILTALYFNFDPDTITLFCSQLSAARAGQCFANAASRVIETDWDNASLANAVCERAGDHGSAAPCYKELLKYSTYNFHKGSREFLALCATLPSTWRTQCLSQ